MNAVPLESDVDEDSYSTHGSDDESESFVCEKSQPPKKGKRKRKDAGTGANTIVSPLKKRAKIGGKKARSKDSGHNIGGSKTFTVEGVLSAFPEHNEYGISFLNIIAARPIRWHKRLIAAKEGSKLSEEIAF